MAESIKAELDLSGEKQEVGTLVKDATFEEIHAALSKVRHDVNARITEALTAQGEEWLKSIP